MDDADARPFGVLGALLAGAVVTLVVMAAAGSDPAVWVAVVEQQVPRVAPEVEKPAPPPAPPLTALQFVHRF